MPSTYAGANTYPASLTIPSDGDPRDAASVNVPIEGLADRTTWLKDRAGNYANLNSGGTPGGSGAHNWSGNFSISENLGVLTLASPKAGDVIELDWWGPLLPLASSGATVSARIAVSENATSYTDAGATWVDANGGFGMQQFGDTVVRWPIYLSCSYTVVDASPLSVMFVVQVNGSAVTGGVDFPTSGTPTPTWGARFTIFRPIP